MAYYIHLYCAVGELDAVRGLDSVISRARDQGVELRLSDQGSGVSGASATLDQAGATIGSSGCTIEFVSWSPLLKQVIGQVLDADPSGRIGLMNARVELTLSGEVDWLVVRAVWTAVKSLWDVVPYDDGSGFDVDLDEL